MESGISVLVFICIDVAWRCAETDHQSPLSTLKGFMHLKGLFEPSRLDERLLLRCTLWALWPSRQLQQTIVILHYRKEPLALCVRWTLNSPWVTLLRAGRDREVRVLFIRKSHVLDRFIVKCVERRGSTLTLKRFARWWQQRKHSDTDDKGVAALSLMSFTDKTVFFFLKNCLIFWGKLPFKALARTSKGVIRNSAGT